MLPLYLEKLTPIELSKRAESLYELLTECSICPNECMNNRLEGEIGKCNSTDKIRISSYGPHFGEEPPLVGFMGSGTIFLTNCHLECKFCQNYDISQMGIGEEISINEMTDLMLGLQKRGCHNINFVTPTHYTPMIIEALILAIEKGLEIPLVYNSSGYESVTTLKLLEDIFDIYMPDIKYSVNENGLKYSGVQNYWDIVKEAVIEMHRQVGDLRISKSGIAQRGLIVRHLILPNNIAGSKKVVDFITDEISCNTYLNLMDQYRPTYLSNKFSELNRRITQTEFDEICRYAANKNLKRGMN